VDCHHDISDALLGSEWEGPCLVGVNLVGEVLNAEESFVGFGDWDVVEKCFFPLILILTVFVSIIFSNAFCFVGWMPGVGPLGILSLSCPSWGNIG
jgi:hypothetical protein